MALTLKKGCIRRIMEYESRRSSGAESHSYFLKSIEMTFIIMGCL